MDGVDNGSEPKHDTEGGDHDLVIVVRLEHRRVGVEVVGPLGVPLLARGIPHDVGRPANDL